MRLRSHFGNNSTPKDTEKIFSKSNSTWEPNDVHHTVKTFVEDFTRQINNSIQDVNKKKSPQKNLTKQEEGALKDLMKRNDIIICNADKGGAVVILDVKVYIKEAERQLSDETFYKKLPSDPTELHTALVNNCIDNLRIKNLIPEKLANGLKVNNQELLYFTYYLNYTKPATLVDLLLAL